MSRIFTESKKSENLIVFTLFIYDKDKGGGICFLFCKFRKLIQREGKAWENIFHKIADALQPGLTKRVSDSLLGAFKVPVADIDFFGA